MRCWLPGATAGPAAAWGAGLSPSALLKITARSAVSAGRLTGTSFPNSQLEAALDAYTSLSGKEQLKIAKD